MMTATKIQQDHFPDQPGKSDFDPDFDPDFDIDAPQCCGTGCVVCVLDYPELFSLNQTDSGQTDCNMLALLEAVEQAQAQANMIIANGDLQ